MDTETEQPATEVAAQKPKRTRKIAVRRAPLDIYTVLLVLSALALGLCILLMFLEWRSYNFQMVPKV